MQMIGLNNLSKVEGIKEQDNDAKVRFIAVEDNKTTLMCKSLNNQQFYINKENIFDRYYGEKQDELRIERIRCKGLVLRSQSSANFSHLPFLSFYYCI